MLLADYSHFRFYVPQNTYILFCNIGDKKRCLWYSENENISCEYDLFEELNPRLHENAN